MVKCDTVLCCRLLIYDNVTDLRAGVRTTLIDGVPVILSATVASIVRAKLNAILDAAAQMECCIMAITDAVFQI